MARPTNEFRKAFKVNHRNILRWFPGHMNKGLKQMRQRLKEVDCVVEVHDARIPLSGRNPNFRTTVSGIKPHILVLNKLDLTDMSLKSKVEEKLHQERFSDVLFTNAKNPRCNGIAHIVPIMRKLMTTANRFNRTGENSLCAMVIGVPNVGKSSVINSLRNRHLRKEKAAHVGAVAGITRSVQSKIKISEDPLIYLLDTPGILTPTIPDVETGMRLALCSCLLDHLVGEEMIADYLLYLLNKYNNFSYVDLMNLDEATDDIHLVLTKYALKINKVMKVKTFSGDMVLVPDLKVAAMQFIQQFRNGKFGAIMVDADRL